MKRLPILPLAWLARLADLLTPRVATTLASVSVILLTIPAHAQSCEGSVRHQGKSYATVQVGNQCWLAENLQATANADGDPLPLLTSAEAWGEQVLSPACCEIAVPGRSEPAILYNRWAAAEVCPSGWHLPTLEEWDALATHLGGWEVAGYGMKSRTGWPSINDRTNRSRFNAKPHGIRDMEGEFNFQGQGAYWWTNTDNDFLVDSWFVWIDDGTMDLFRYPFFNTFGFSVRCVQNDTTP